ncbi:MAG: T9SS type A sorting domain-containing protein, partial [Dysgonamonadaceae bacterium]|nr:T9SS type A sorting domain-containing protein [Dysgonamonadaceae bacterium]
TTALEIGMRQNYAICLYIPKYDNAVSGVSDHQHLDALHGVIELPYFENATADAHHPLHTYTGGVSQIYYYSGYDFSLLDEHDDITRASEAYRFIFENNSNQPQDPFKISVPVVDSDNDSQIDEVMIANPFLSSLDFDVLYRDNSTLLEPYYRLYRNAAFETRPLLTGGLIAPMQAFFVRPIGTLGTEVEIKFTKAASVARTETHQLKGTGDEIADDNIAGLIRLTAENAEGSSYTSLVFYYDWRKNVDWMYYTGLDIEYSGVLKTEAPQIYSHDQYNNAERAIQYIAAEGRSLDVPIGIRVNGDGVGKYRLKFESLGELNPAALTLLDKKTGKRLSLVNNSNIYEFEVEMNLEPQDLNERFELLVGKTIFTPMGVEAVVEAEVFASVNDGILQVTSTVSNIREVTVTGIQGVRLSRDAGIDSSTFSKRLNVAPGVYLATVKLSNGKTVVKKFIVK